jgi:hypothetical protein
MYLKCLEGCSVSMSLELIKSYLASVEWNKYEQVDKDIIRFRLKADNATYTSFFKYVTTDEGSPNVQQIRVYVVQDMFNDISQEKKFKVFEMFNKISIEYFFPKCMMDEDGDIAVEYTFPIDDRFVSQDEFLRVFNALIHVADEIYPQLMKLKWA